MYLLFALSSVIVLSSISILAIWQNIHLKDSSQFWRLEVLPFEQSSGIASHLLGYQVHMR